MKRQLHAFWHAVGFLTRWPVPKTLDMAAWPASPPWYPVVGLLFGLLLALTAWALHFLVPPLVLAMLVVTLWVYMTGGLHLDGLMDTADGFWSHRSRERTLEIMKDSRVGAMGVLAALLLLGNKVAALASLHGDLQLWALLLAPLLARGAMLFALLHMPYAREDGLATSLRAIGKTGRTVPFLFVGVSLLATAFFVKIAAAWAVLIAVLATAVLLRASLKKIGGCTGDVYGALCELVETAVLLGFALGGGLV